MRLRTKLFLTSTGAMLLLWLGAYLSIRHAVKLRIDQMANESFEGTKQGLAGMQKERIARMQQAGRLVMNIPDLRALIAEQSSELSVENRASLKERLDALEGIVGASFVTVFDNRQRVVEQSAHAPWRDVREMNQYTATTAQPASLIRHVFMSSKASTTEAAGLAEYGLWPYAGKLYQIVAIPLVFAAGNDGGPVDVDGALVLGEQIDDAAAKELGSSHNCQVTFLTDAAIVASGLDTASRNELAGMYRHSDWPISQAFIFHLHDATVHGSIQPLPDVSSSTIVGQMLIERDDRDSIIETKMQHSLALIMGAGLLAAAIGSFVISAAITRPVQQLAKGVQKVAQGNLDLTLPVKSHDELGDLSASFNDMVSQLRSRRQLVQQVEQAQSASRAKSQFLANMSHEIRTPLNGVIGMTELLLGTSLTDQQRRYAHLVKTSGSLLTALINDILDFSKIEAGKLEIESIDFNLHEVVEEVIALLSERAARKKLELACHFNRDVPKFVRGDPDRLRQILVNLINNAIKFTTAGSVVVSVVCEKGGPEKTIAKFSVTDTGIGVPPDRMDRLFKPFSQVDSSTTRKYGGTGLGLAITKQLAELMGGTVGVESAPLRGSTFWFTVTLDNRPAPIEPEGVVLFDPEELRVLAVDDSQTTRTVLQEQLSSWGIVGQTVGGTDQALAELRKAAAAGRPFKVVIIDSDMPGSSGFELARAIKNDPQLRKTALMALLPLEVAADAAQLREAGFAEHMTKPVRQSQLFDGLMRAIAREHGQALRNPEPQPQAAAITRGHGRILVGEDNEVNQTVVTELLKGVGYECHVAENGLKVIEAYVSGQFDLILMDCQMPEMDGFEATRIIRQKEMTQQRSRIPIIALTANAMKGDREQCLQSGMDGYCSKPVDARNLLTTMASLLNGKTPAMTKQHEVTASASTELPAIVVDTLIERCMNNAATVNIVINKFEKQVQQDIQQLQESIAASDVAAVARIAHSLKGAASIVAADQVSKAAGELEKLGRDKQTADMDKYLSQLRAETNRCLEYLPRVRSAASEKLSAKTHSLEGKS